MLILFPGERAGSVGELLARALARMGASAVMLGWPSDLSAAATVLRRERPDVVAGAPVPMLALAQSLGFKRVREGDGSGLVRVVLDLNEEP